MDLAKARVAGPVRAHEPTFVPSAFALEQIQFLNATIPGSPSALRPMSSYQGNATSADHRLVGGC